MISISKVWVLLLCSSTPWDENPFFRRGKLGFPSSVVSPEIVKYLKIGDLVAISKSVARCFRDFLVAWHFSRLLLLKLISSVSFWIAVFTQGLSEHSLVKRQIGDDRRVVCYYANWAVYRQGTAKFTPQNINPYLCTHLIYAFAGLGKDDTIQTFDKYQDLEKGNNILLPHSASNRVKNTTRLCRKLAFRLFSYRKFLF